MFVINYSDYEIIKSKLKATQDKLAQSELELEAVKHARDVLHGSYINHLEQLATAKLEGFNEGIEAAANECAKVGGNDNGWACESRIYALKKEVK